MATKNFTKSIASACIISLAMALVGCSAESAESTFAPEVEPATKATEVPFSIVIKALSDGKDITTKEGDKTTTLFIFDDNYDFVNKVNVSNTTIKNRREVEFNVPGCNRVTVIAWSGLNNNNEEVSSLSQANIIQDLQVSLKANNGYANTPSDLFYGQVTLNRSQTKAAATELAVERKTATLSMRAMGIDSSEGEFIFIVKQAKSGFAYNGELTGEEATYVIPARVTPNGNIVTDLVPVLATSDIDVELHKDGEIVFSAKNVKNNENVTLSEGKHVNLTFDMNKTAMNVYTSDWGVEPTIIAM